MFLLAVLVPWCLVGSADLPLPWLDLSRIRSVRNTLDYSIYIIKARYVVFNIKVSIDILRIYYLRGLGISSLDKKSLGIKLRLVDIRGVTTIDIKL